MAKVVARERAVRWQIAEKLRRQAARLSPIQLRWLVVLSISAGLMVYTWIGIRAVSGPPGPGHFSLRDFPLAPKVVMKKGPGFADTVVRLKVYPDH